MAARWRSREVCGFLNVEAHTEDHVHHWYGTILSFRRSVVRIVKEGVEGTVHQEYEERLARFPEQILPVGFRLSRWR
ncbi:hypothetical protein N7519_005104 [Penicillium mononematosum]|uniref:uncharacterized protein n=1 Tax=Penicillium mononematosum TaxID=268346 RepID=UPI002548EE97|nr:uncharacterized protein N7519_005104 [Penicillium mononematosum]KAJ6183803.1 hypothetical protein N7519_005104 [Penicillium mononematosum]